MPGVYGVIKRYFKHSGVTFDKQITAGVHFEHARPACARSLLGILIYEMIICTHAS